MTKARLTVWVEQFKHLESEADKEDFLSQLKQEISTETHDEAEEGLRTLRDWVKELHERILEKAV